MSAPPQAAPPVAAAAAIEPTRSLRDFGDWLGPMIVKELRQGMRTRIFVTAFIVLQGVLAVTLLTGLGVGSAGESSVIFWGVLFVTLCIVMPLRGFGALANEDRLHTMDLILMTRLTSWRITFGKWAALVSQSTLIVVSMLPYVVLRYFLGGVNVFSDIFWVAAFLVASFVLTAVTVGFSAHSLFIIRAAAAAGTLFLAGVWMSYAGMHINNGSLPFPQVDQRALILTGFAAVAAYAVYYLLDMGASVIAPTAENHATRKRVSVLLVLAVLLVIAILGGDEEILLAVGSIVALAGALDALNEEPAVLPGIVAPFVRRGLIGRLAGRFLYPGWHTALNFVVLLVALFAIYLLTFMNLSLVDVVVGSRSDLEEVHVFVSMVAAVLLPAAFIQVFFPRTRHLFSTYIFIQGILGLYYVLIAILAESIRSELYLLGIFVPFLTLAGGLQYDPLLEAMFIASSALAVISALALFLRALPVFRKTREVERTTAQRLSLDEDPALEVPFPGATPVPVPPRTPDSDSDPATGPTP